MNDSYTNDFRFITEIIQRGRIKPAKFIHSIEIQYRLYKELKLHEIIKPENYFIYETAFFEFKNERVIISFVNRALCDALHFAIDRFLIIDATGNYPIKRTYQSKMNNDKSLRT
jgi:hypothetical protein